MLIVFFSGMFFFLNAQNASAHIQLTGIETIAAKVKKVAHNTITYLYCKPTLKRLSKKAMLLKLSLRERNQEFSSTSKMGFESKRAAYEYPPMKANLEQFYHLNLFSRGRPDLIRE